ncbi:uncharacterized protein LOC108678158 isoform X2 [Hyalella azteca]|uniref:Uncharacterized protein LOC108678158 isoform X2 n=1 Tax=Hyalella azteca TaxID=294128 RepID=A0A979FXQ1_HYAAZ|nr:uncharacterized protein LOC108678158 isoform X2 [Hyalella azteca]
MFQYIILLSNRKFLVKVANKEELLQAAKERLQEKGLLKSQQCHLEYYMANLNTYCEVDPEDLADSGILKMVFDTPEILDDERNLSACPVTQRPAEENILPVSTTRREYCENSTESVHSVQTANMLDHSPNDIQQPSSSPASMEVMKCTNLNETLNPKWPAVFSISSNIFPKTLREALEAEETLNRKNMTELLDCLYNLITKFTFYPTKQNYHAVALALLMKYPHLKKDIEFGDAVEIWRTRMSMKARNARQRRDSQEPCVMAMRAKKKLHLPQEENDDMPPKKIPKNVPAFGVVNYMPSKPLTEDDISIQRHRTQMINELKKKAPNPRTIEELMKLTFHDRRQLIITENATVAYIAELYPAIFNPNQILFEFERLTEINLMEKLRESMKIHGRAIHLLSQVAIPEKRDLDSAEYEDQMMSSALLLIPALMRETIKYDMPVEVSSSQKAGRFARYLASPKVSWHGLARSTCLICLIQNMPKKLYASFNEPYLV